MSYIVSEIYEAFIAASDLRRVPGGVRFMAVVTVVLLASLLTAAGEGQGGGLFSVVDPSAPRSRTPAVLTLNLFDDDVFTGIVEQPALTFGSKLASV